MKFNAAEYADMIPQQRAGHLLELGVEAKLDIDPESLTPGYVPHVIGVGKLLACGYHESEQAAIEAGNAWLREKANTPNGKS